MNALILVIPSPKYFILLKATRNPYSGPTTASAAWNGSLMRLAPVPLSYANSFIEAVEKSGESSRTTHGAIGAVDSCRYLGGLIAGATTRVDKKDLLSERYSREPGYWDDNPLCTEVDTVAKGLFKEKSPPVVKRSGYVVECLEAALWAFYNADSFEEGCLLAVNLGDDSEKLCELATYGS